MKVVITEAAYADLFRIGSEIKKDSPARAESFVSELHDRCRKLGSMPRAFPLLPDWEDRAVRRRVHGNYLIFYQIGAEAVEVLRILHGAMDYERILFPED